MAGAGSQSLTIARSRTYLQEVMEDETSTEDLPDTAHSSTDSAAPETTSDESPAHISTPTEESDGTPIENPAG